MALDGWAVGLVCYRDAVQAGAAACAQVSGVTAGGVASCSAPTVTAGVLAYTLEVASASSTVTRAVTMQLQPCELQDLEEWAPAIGAWFLSLVLVLVTRQLYTRTFGRENL